MLLLLQTHRGRTATFSVAISTGYVLVERPASRGHSPQEGQASHTELAANSVHRCALTLLGPPRITGIPTG